MNITVSKIIPWSLLHHSVNCGKKDDFRCAWEGYADTAHFGSKSLTVNHSKADKIWILSQYSQFSAAWTKIPNVKLKIYHSLLSVQLDSTMLATSSAILWGQLLPGILSTKFMTLICRVTSGFLSQKATTNQKKRKPGFCDSSNTWFTWW